MDAYADAVAVALEDPDPWNGFADVLMGAHRPGQGDGSAARGLRLLGLVLLHMANAGDADAWRRVVALFIQSFEAPARGALPASTEHDALYRAMLRAGPAADAVPDARTN